MGCALFSAAATLPTPCPTGFAQLLSPRRERVGQLEYSIRLHKPLPKHWLVEYHESQKAKLTRPALTLDDKVFDGRVGHWGSRVFTSGGGGGR